jgi:predicted Zn-dependent protease
MNLKDDKRANRVVADAAKLRDAGRYQEAISLLTGVQANYPDSPAILGTIGGVLYAAKRFEEAKAYFSRVTALRPNAELASLALFHCLWKLGQQDAARAELVRFASSNDSKEYARLLEEMGWRFERRTATRTDT